MRFDEGPGRAAPAHWYWEKTHRTMGQVLADDDSDKFDRRLAMRVEKLRSEEWSWKSIAQRLAMPVERLKYLVAKYKPIGVPAPTDDPGAR